MKKILALMLAFCLIFSLAGCGCAKKYDSDLEKLEATGKMVIGITIYEPMNYMDENNQYTGFDTEFAQAFCESLGVEAEFVEIDWNTKFATLAAGEIDCVWNGMTITDEAKLNASVSDPYVKNQQVVVMKKDVVANYPDAVSLKNVSFAVENGSAGAGAVSDTEQFTGKITATETQAKALMEVAAGTSEACVIDKTMAESMTGEGTSYSDLAIGVTLTDEQYGVAFRKDSDLTAKLNEFMAAAETQKTLADLAAKYKVTLASDAGEGSIPTIITGEEEAVEAELESESEEA